ncbi:hypothetical protein HMN09_00349000 [Mycena chlorophos]|uniref:Uncharacterized protein n=1 Tax=Mycena chlorophos TaxID=658473 RepID=A0A8H6TIL7_MYCCL|nr:hypothetical protein HMN09_00349000 [Mycena chlorophos]
MQFAKVLSLLAVGVACSLASPLPVANPHPKGDMHNAAAALLKRQSNDVLPLTIKSVFDTLEEAVAALDPGLETIIQTSGGGEDPSAAVIPLVSNVVDALNTATSQLASVAPGDQGAADQDLADLINSVLADLFQALNTLLPKLGLSGAIGGLDTAVAALLTTLNASLLPGVLSLVGGLLTALAPLVGGLVGGLGVGNL